MSNFGCFLCVRWNVTAPFINNGVKCSAWVRFQSVHAICLLGSLGFALLCETKAIFWSRAAFFPLKGDSKDIKNGKGFFF